MIASVALGVSLLLAAPGATVDTSLGVPLIRQSRERCGPAALRMVLRYFHAAPAAEAEADAAYDRVLRGALITELAAAARRAGFEAAVEAPGQDSLAALLDRGLPPILLIDAGTGPLHKGHYVVLVGWSDATRVVTVHDGGPRPRAMSRAVLMKRWRSAGGQALVVRPR